MADDWSAWLPTAQRSSVLAAGDWIHSLRVAGGFFRGMQGKITQGSLMPGSGVLLTTGFRTIADAMTAAGAPGNVANAFAGGVTTSLQRWTVDYDRTLDACFPYPEIHKFGFSVTASASVERPHYPMAPLDPNYFSSAEMNLANPTQIVGNVKAAFWLNERYRWRNHTSVRRGVPPDAPPDPPPGFDDAANGFAFWFSERYRWWRNHTSILNLEGFGQWQSIGSSEWLLEGTLVSGSPFKVGPYEFTAWAQRTNPRFGSDWYWDLRS
jgi:hypothetical protein